MPKYTGELLPIEPPKLSRYTGELLPLVEDQTIVAGPGFSAPPQRGLMGNLGAAWDTLTGQDSTIERPLIARIGDAGGQVVDAITPDAFQRGTLTGKQTAAQLLEMSPFGPPGENLPAHAADLASLEREKGRYPQSAQNAAALKAMSDAKGVGEWADAVTPGALGDVVLESLGQQTPVLAASLAGGPLSIGANAAGSLAMEYTGAIRQAMAEQGIDLADASAVQAFLANPEAMAAAKASGLKRGVPIAAFDAVTAGLAGKLFNKSGVGNAIKRSAADLVLGAGGGMAGETTAQFADKGEIESLGDILTEGAAEGPSGVLEGIGNVARARRAPATPAEAGAQAAEDALAQAKARPGPVVPPKASAPAGAPPVTPDTATSGNIQAEIDAMLAGTPPPALQPKPSASVPFMVTAKMKADLRARGLSDTDISAMTPEQAHARLAEPVPAADPEQTIANPIPRDASPEQKLAAIRALSAENQPSVDAFLADVDGELGTASKSSLKADERILAKASRPSILAAKPWHGIEHVRDTLRFKTVLNSPADLERIAQKVQGAGWEVVKVDTAKMLKPKEWGWRFVALDLRMPNGQLVEYYMPMKGMEAAKKGGNHQLFEKWRGRDIPSLTPAEQREFVGDLASSNAAYEAAYQSDLASAGADESALRASLANFEASAGSSTRSKSSLSSSAENMSLGTHLPPMREAAKPSSNTITREPSGTAETSISVTSDAIVAEPGGGRYTPPGGASQTAAIEAGLTNVASTVAPRVPGAGGPQPVSSARVGGLGRPDTSVHAGAGDPSIPAAALEGTATAPVTPTTPPSSGVRTSAAPESSRAKRLRREIEHDFSGFANAPKIEVWDTPADMPEGKPRLTALDSESEGEGVEGMFDPDTNTVHFFAGRLTTPTRRKWVAMHEVSGHAGLRGYVAINGRGAGSLDKTLAAARSHQTIDALARAVAADRDMDLTLNPALLNLATEEAAAELIAAEETGDWSHIEGRYGVSVPERMRPGIKAAILRLLDRIKGLFRTIDPSTESFTDADWRALAKGAMRYGRATPKAKPVNDVAPKSAPERATPEVGENSPRPLKSTPPRATVTGMRSHGYPASAGNPISLFRSDAEIKAHPDYRAAKAGDTEAASRLVGDLASPLVADTAKFGRGVIYVAPHAYEASGDNAIPQMLAAYLAVKHGARTDETVFQDNQVFHTGADPMQRMIAPSVFSGEVEPGAQYVLVDDVTTMGGTLADLASYLQEQGGEVVGSVVLVNAARSGTIIPDGRKVQLIERRYGDEIRSTLQVEPSALTAEEASYLIGFRSADEIRGRVSAAQEARDRRLRAKGVLPELNDSPAPPSEGPGASGPLKSTAPRTQAQKDALTKAGLPVDERTTMERLRDKIGEQWADLKDIASGNAKQRVFDRFDRMRAIEQDLGTTPEDSAYLSARLAVGLPSIMEGVMLYGAPKWEGGVLAQKDGTVGLLDALKPVAADIDGWLGWMVGRRAKALKAQGREQLMSDADIDALISLAQGKEAAFQKAALDYLKIKTAVLDVAEQAGLIDPEGRKTWDSVEYIPFYRADEATDTTLGPGTKKGLGGQSSGIRQLKGGTQNLADPLGNIVRNFTRLIDASLKNHAMLQAVDQYGPTFFDKQPMAGSFEKVPMSQVKQHLLDSGVPQAMIDQMPQEALTGLLKLWTIKPPTDEDVVRVMRDGRPEYYKVPDPDLLRSLTSFKAPNKHPAIKPFIFAKRLLTAGVTSSPEFMLRNFIRDSGSAWVISDDKFRLGWDSAVGIVKPLLDDSHRRAMMFAGGSFIGGQVHGGAPDETASALRRDLRKKGLTSKQIEDHLATLARTPLAVWDKWQAIGSAIENANRNAVYEAALKAGRSPKEAAYLARDLMDFSMQGDSVFVQMLADVLPFFNARLQGLYKLYRQGGKKRLRKALLMRAATITTATAALLAWNLMMHADGYDELEEWDKDAYWHIAPGTEHHIRIPKPFELGVLFATVPERVAMAVMGRDRLDQFGKSMLTQVSGTLAMNPVPQGLMPMVELWANKKAFTGRPIEHMGDEQLLPEARAEWYTSDTAKILSDVLGNSTGLSPKKIEHLWNGYTGTVGAYALDTVDWLVRHVEGAEPRPELAWAELPLLKAVYRGDMVPKATRYTTEFYELVNKANDTAQTIKEFELAGQTERAADLEAEWGWLVGERVESKRAKGGFMHQGVRDINKVRDRLGDIRKEIDGIVAMPGYTPEEKRAQIDALALERNALAKQFTSALRATQRNQ